MNKLQISGDKAKGSSTPNHSSKPTKQKNKHSWDCGKPDCVKGHEGCTQPGKCLHVPNNFKTKATGTQGTFTTGKIQAPPPADAPKDGEPEVCTKSDGTVEKYCSKCRKSQWQSGDKAHTTTENRVGKPSVC